MYNLYTKFVKILEICKQFSENLVNESGNVPRRGPVPKFSDLEVVALSLTAETESIDSEKWLFDYKLQEYKDCIPNLISRRQFNDRRKKTAGLCEELRKRVAMEMDGGEEQFFVDSKPIEVCRVARGKRCKMGRTGDFSQAPDFGFCASQNSIQTTMVYLDITTKQEEKALETLEGENQKKMRKKWKTEEGKANLEILLGLTKTN